MMYVAFLLEWATVFLQQCISSFHTKLKEGQPCCDSGACSTSTLLSRWPLSVYRKARKSFLVITSNSLLSCSVHPFCNAEVLICHNFDKVFHFKHASFVDIFFSWINSYKFPRISDRNVTVGVKNSAQGRPHHHARTTDI